jgi:SAM-dependent methyltransferase
MNPNNMSTGNIKTLNNNIRHDSCPCCKSRSLSFIETIKYAKNVQYSSSLIKLAEVPELWQCEKCESWFTQNIIAEKDSIDLYSNGSSWISKEFKDSKSPEVIESLKLLNIKDKKILDIGCANGSLLNFARENNALTYGLEYSIENRTLLKENGHLAYGDWSEIDERFDIITAFDLIEHLYDIELFFDFCRRYLSQNGILLIMTGNIFSASARSAKQSWWYLRYPEHIVFPSRKYYSSLEHFNLISYQEVYPYKIEDTNLFTSIFNAKNIKIGARIFIASIFKDGKHFPSLKIAPDHALAIFSKK